ncbi:MCF2L isoform 13, partial [Pongo abelii]
SAPLTKPPEKGKGWSKTSHSLEAPEDDGGWSSAEEQINSSDAEEDGGLGPKKLVPTQPPIELTRGCTFLRGDSPHPTTFYVIECCH